MHRLAAVLFVSLLAPPLLTAPDRYRFHVKVTDGETALRANPALAELHMSDAQLARAADDRVLLFDRVEGAHWKWLMLSWLYDGPAPEYALNDRGTAKSSAAADFSIEPVDSKRFRARCLRDRCRFLTTSLDGREVVTDLERGGTTEMRFDSDVDVELDTAREPKSKD
jgi:hypothetical protein